DPKYLADLGRAIYDSLAKSDPQAVWVLQGWAFMNQRHFWTQPRFKAFLDAVPHDRMVVLDLMCEQTPAWDKTEAFCGKPWLWCNIETFGRAVHLSGALSRIGQDLPALRRQPRSGKLSGLGFVNEGLGYNPVVYDLMFEMAWRDGPVNLKQWIGEYAWHRYGRDNEDARRAWEILLDVVYDGAHYTRSIVDQGPQVQTAAAQAPYDNVRLAGAWQALLAAADELGNVDTFRFDLANVARQVLSNHAAVLHTAMVKAAQEKNTGALGAASEQFLQLIRDMDELLATRREFLLGSWLEDAKRWGATDTERARFEWNARRVLTQWGQTAALDDYAHKEWSGMLNGYYLKRWELFLPDFAESLKSGQLFDDKAFQAKVRKWTADWSDQRETYPTRPQGDSIELAKKLWAKYEKQLR
ncbi:MAG: alpha-N-acetylglucosaminidase, partial [Planctomycetaceae bacterium]